MYVPQGSVPQNSMSPPDPRQRARYIGRIMSMDQAATKAFLAVECPPSPISFLDQPRGVLQEAIVAQSKGILAAQGTNAAPGTYDPTATSASASPVNSLVGSTPAPLNNSPAQIKRALREAPQVVPLNGPPPGCRIEYFPPMARKTPQPVALKPAPVLVQSSQFLSPPPVSVPPSPPPTAAAQLTTSYPPSNPCPPGQQLVGNGPQCAVPFSPCPPGVPFQNRYIGGAPVCGSMNMGGPVAQGGGWQRGYASIAGLGDAPRWGDAFESVGLPSNSSFQWKWLLIGAAGVGLLAWMDTR